MIDLMISSAKDLRSRDRVGRTMPGTAIRSQPATERFYREIGHWAAERGWLQLGFLRLDGRCTAFYFSLVEGGSLYALKTGFDSKFAAFGPGTSMARAAIERSFADGLARFEFLGSDQRYKLHWTSTVHERVRVQAFPRSLSGTAGFVGSGSRSAGRTARARRRDAPTSSSRALGAHPCFRDERAVYLARHVVLPTLPSGYEYPPAAGTRARAARLAKARVIFP